MTVVPIRHPRPLAALALAGALATVLAGCSGTTAPSAVASAVANASLPPVATEAPTTATSEAPTSAGTEAPAASAGPSAVATDIDPCQLITAADASTLVGVTFGAGKAHTTENNVKSCIYSAGTNIFTVEVAVAPDEATAKAAEAGAKQDLENQTKKSSNVGLKVTELPGFAQGADAALMEGSATSPFPFEGRAMFILKGTIFAGFSDIAVNGKAPSADAMKAEATKVIGELP